MSGYGIDKTLERKERGRKDKITNKITLLKPQYCRKYKKNIKVYSKNTVKTFMISSAQRKRESYKMAVRKHFLRHEISTRKYKYLKLNQTFKTQVSNIHLQDIIDVSAS